MNGGIVWACELATVALWLGAVLAALWSIRDSSAGLADRLYLLLTLCGLVVILGTLIGLWLHLGRPPLRTLGETRLWYAALSVLAGGILAWRLRTTALRLPMLCLGSLFLGLNLALPHSLDRTLMPALQSPWFVPHVVVYLLSYAVLGLSAAVAGWRWLRRDFNADLPWRLVHAGVPLLTFGLLMGAVWAKEAWGHYWAWDPKETWALLTWIAYVALLHLERSLVERPRLAQGGIVLAFAVVLMCWFLVNHLPSTDVSVHTYSRQN
jgi:ABC-type transport system involved in cytochrome c biogenesis permease subunit